MVNKIKKDLIIAMKAKDIITRDILRVLIGEFQRNFITNDNDAVIKIIKKMVQNLKEIGGSDEEIKILSKYLPEQLSEDRMIALVIEFIDFNKLNSPSEMGRVMGYFKENFAGLYDGKLLSNIVKNELS